MNEFEYQIAKRCAMVETGVSKTDAVRSICDYVEHNGVKIEDPNNIRRIFDKGLKSSDSARLVIDLFKRKNSM